VDHENWTIDQLYMKTQCTKCVTNRTG